MSYFFTSKRRAVLTAAENFCPGNIGELLEFAFLLKSPESVFDALVEYILRVYEDKVLDIPYALVTYIEYYSSPMQQKVIDLFIEKGKVGALVFAKRKLNMPLEEREISALLISMIYLKKTNEEDTSDILNLFQSRCESEPEMTKKHEMVFNETLGKDLDIPVLEDEVKTLENTKPSLEE